MLFRSIHIQDLCDAIYQASQLKLPSTTFNLAFSKLISLDEIGKEVQTRLSENFLLIDKGERTSIRNPVSDKFYEYYNWKPSVDLSLGVQKIIQFYRAINHE